MIEATGDNECRDEGEVEMFWQFFKQGGGTSLFFSSSVWLSKQSPQGARPRDLSCDRQAR